MTAAHPLLCLSHLLCHGLLEMKALSTQDSRPPILRSLGPPARVRLQHFSSALKSTYCLRHTVLLAAKHDVHRFVYTKEGTLRCSFCLLQP